MTAAVKLGSLLLNFFHVNSNALSVQEFSVSYPALFISEVIFGFHFRVRCCRVRTRVMQRTADDDASPLRVRPVRALPVWVFRLFCVVLLCG